MADSKQRGAMPPTDMARVAQQDIGKVARLFRDSGFRYRVFDSETGEHQIVDPVRPLPPMDHVPPVWPPPLSADELAPPPPRAAAPAESRPVPASPPRVAPAAPAPVASPVAKAVPAAAPPAAAAPAPETARAAVRAQTETDRIFRAVALGASPAPAAAPAPPSPPVAAVPVPPRPAPSAAPATPTPKESNMSARPASPAESTARQMGRVVTLPSRAEVARSAPEVPSPDVGGTPLRVRDGRSVATVMGNVLQPPAPPAKRPPASTAALMQQLFGARRKDG